MTGEGGAQAMEGEKEVTREGTGEGGEGVRGGGGEGEGMSEAHQGYRKGSHCSR